MATPKPSPTAKSSPTAVRTKKPVQTKNLMVKLLLSSRYLAQFPAAVKSEPPIETVPIVKDEPTTVPPTISHTAPTDAAINTPLEGGSPTKSGSNTPAPSSLDDSSAMPPPSAISKLDIKKGIKRSSDAAALNTKPRAKPGPKKKKLEDGSVITTSTGQPKLGPKANQGAINAGLRALDRSGKPCRKWSRGKFEIKSFTGSTWGIGRWTAPAKTTNTMDTMSSSGDSSKTPKENSTSQPTKSDQNSINTPDLVPAMSQDTSAQLLGPIH